jgi:hypothetical protein
MSEKPQETPSAAALAPTTEASAALAPTPTTEASAAPAPRPTPEASAAAAPAPTPASSAAPATAVAPAPTLTASATPAPAAPAPAAPAPTATATPAPAAPKPAAPAPTATATPAPATPAPATPATAAPATAAPTPAAPTTAVAPAPALTASATPAPAAPAAPAAPKPAAAPASAKSASAAPAPAASPALTPTPASDASPPCVRGRLVGRWNAGARRVFFVLFGLVYLQQLGRLLAWLFGHRAGVELTFSDTAIRARTATSMLGARLGETDDLYPLASLGRVTVALTARGTFLWAGGALFAAAVALAVVLAFRGRVGFGGSLALAAVAFVMLGLALDLGAYALVQRLAATGRARLEIVTRDGRWIGIAGIPRDEARRFVDEVALHLPKARRE